MKHRDASVNNLWDVLRALRDGMLDTVTLKRQQGQEILNKLERAEQWRDYYRAQWLGLEAVPSPPVPEVSETDE